MRSRKIENYKRSLSLTDHQREVLIGVLLGDAHLESRSGGRIFRLKVEQSRKHESYVNHLYEIFREWVLSPPRIRKVEIAGKQLENICFQTVSHEAFRFYAHQFYRERKKSVPKQIHRWLTPVSFAYWYMDDGSIKSHESKGVVLNTQGFELKGVKLLLGAIQKNFGFDAKERKQKDGIQIYISGKSYDGFRRLIDPYIIPEMIYKIPTARRTQLPKK